MMRPYHEIMQASENEPSGSREQPIKRSQEAWDLFFYNIAQSVASLSKDPDRKVGAVIVAPDKRQMSFGYNGFPPGIEDLPSLLADREYKLVNMVHAEDNALKQAPFLTDGCTVYVTRFPCLGCAEKLKDAGIRKIVAPTPDFTHHRWGSQWKQATELLAFNNVAVVQANDEDDAFSEFMSRLVNARVTQSQALKFTVTGETQVIVGGGGSGGNT
jgi:dCMP deaminase